MSTFPSEIVIAPDVLSRLADYSIHTVREYLDASADGRPDQILTPDERIEMFVSVAGSVGRRRMELRQ